MMGSPINKNSKNIMGLIKPGTRGAEIGVWEGSSSVKFAAKGLEKLYLVDPWAVSGYDETRQSADHTHNHQDWLIRYSKLTGGTDEESFTKYYNEVYDRVVKLFENKPEVEIRRQTSTEFFNTFEDEKLDWIYIDGDHSYSAVKRDLNGALKVLKKGGMILGDDYRWESDGDKGGVKAATREFAYQNKFKIHRHGPDQFRIVV